MEISFLLRYIRFIRYVDKFLCFDIFWLRHDRLSGHEWKYLKTIPQAFREPVSQTGKDSNI